MKKYNSIEEMKADNSGAVPPEELLAKIEAEVKDFVAKLREGVVKDFLVELRSLQKGVVK